MKKQSTQLENLSTGFRTSLSSHWIKSSFMLGERPRQVMIACACKARPTPRDCMPVLMACLTSFLFWVPTFHLALMALTPLCILFFFFRWGALAGVGGASSASPADPASDLFPSSAALGTGEAERAGPEVAFSCGEAPAVAGRLCLARRVAISAAFDTLRFAIASSRFTEALLGLIRPRGTRLLGGVMAAFFLLFLSAMRSASAVALLSCILACLLLSEASEAFCPFAARVLCPRKSFVVDNVEELGNGLCSCVGRRRRPKPGRMFFIPHASSRSARSMLILISE